MNINHYNEKGFYIEKNLFNKASIDDVVSNIKKPFADQLNLSNNNKLFHLMKQLFDKDISKYKKTISVLSRLFSVQRLLTNNKVIEKLEDIGLKDLVIPTGPVVHIMSESLKIPGGYYGQGAHQDWTSMQGSLDAVIVWIPLVNIDCNLYPLEVIPGSHKEGLRKGEIEEFYYKINTSEYNEKDFIPVEVNVGDVIFMSCWTIHRTGLNGRKNDVRLGCSIRYENINEPTYIERGYPTAYKRSVDRELFDEDFPSINDVNNIFSKLY